MIKTPKRPLWAPWRIEFIRSSKNSECFLCGKDKNRQSPDEELVIKRGKKAFVILNRFPYNSGHLMIAPYRHIADISRLDKDEKIEIMDLLVEAKEILDKVMCPQGFNAGVNLGDVAGAGVKDHIHFHLVPRWLGDVNFMPVLGDTRVVPEALVETANMIKKTYQKIKK